MRMKDADFVALMGGYGDLGALVEVDEGEEDEVEEIRKHETLKEWERRVDKSTLSESKWSSLRVRKGEIHASDIPTKKAGLWKECGTKVIGNFDVQIATSPFELGGVRAAFHARVRELDTWIPYVAKMFLEEKHRSKKEYLVELETNGVLVFLAKEWMKGPGRHKKQMVTAIESRALKINDGEKDIWYHLEEVIDGHFDKWTDNGGKTFSARENRTILEFSKWTYVWTDRFLMATDMQGAKTEEKYVLTDPAIVCPSMLGRFGPTNLGEIQLKMCLEIIDHNLRTSCGGSESTRPRGSSTDGPKARSMRLRASCVVPGRLGHERFTRALKKRTERLKSAEDARKKRKEDSVRLITNFYKDQPAEVLMTAGVVSIGAFILGGAEFWSSLCSIFDTVHFTYLCTKHTDALGADKYLTIWLLLKPMLMLENALYVYDDGTHWAIVSYFIRTFTSMRRWILFLRCAFVIWVRFDIENTLVYQCRDTIDKYTNWCFHRACDMHCRYRDSWKIEDDSPISIIAIYLPIFIVGSILSGLNSWSGYWSIFQILAYVIPAHQTLGAMNFPEVESYRFWMRYWIIYGSLAFMSHLLRWQFLYCAFSAIVYIGTKHLIDERADIKGIIQTECFLVCGLLFIFVIYLLASGDPMEVFIGGILGNAQIAIEASAKNLANDGGKLAADVAQGGAELANKLANDGGKLAADVAQRRAELAKKLANDGGTWFDKYVIQPNKGSYDLVKSSLLGYDEAMKWFSENHPPPPVSNDVTTCTASTYFWFIYTYCIWLMACPCIFGLQCTVWVFVIVSVPLLSYSVSFCSTFLQMVGV